MMKARALHGAYIMPSGKRYLLVSQGAAAMTARNAQKYRFP
jgi:hypothetical protein